MKELKIGLENLFLYKLLRILCILKFEKMVSEEALSSIPKVK